jgi:hypothetical protein
MGGRARVILPGIPDSSMAALMAHTLLKSIK